MATTQTIATKVTDHHGKCNRCGATLSASEAIITYWDNVETVDMGRRTVIERGISEIDLHAGICKACQVKEMRENLERKANLAKDRDPAAPGGGAVVGFGIGIFSFTVALLLKTTTTDEFGNPMPIFTIWFYIWAALDLICIIGLPIALKRRKRLCESELISVTEAEKLSDEELFRQYQVVDGVPFMKIAWDEYMVKMAKEGRGGLVYASELLKLGSAGRIAKEMRIKEDMASMLLSAAYRYAK